jgi:hypothetical protein
MTRAMPGRPRFNFLIQLQLLFYFNFSSNVSVIPDVGKKDLIAIGNTEAFQTLSTSDLANCKCLGKTFFWEGRSWLNWTMSLSQLFNHEDNEQLTAIIMDLRKQINGDFDASQLLKGLDTIQKVLC